LCEDICLIHQREIHLNAARAIWKLVDQEEVAHKMFDILNHFRLSQHHTESKKEKKGIATLCLHACQHASGISSFSEALSALDLGIKLLGDGGWRENYDLTLALHNHAAEVQMSMGNIVLIDEVVDPILEHGRVPTDKVQACCARIHSLGRREQHAEAISTGIAMLGELGYSVSDRISTLHLFLKIQRLLRRLRRKSDGQILRLPQVQDNQKLAILRILHDIVVSAIGQTRPEIVAYVAVLSTEITLDYGLSVFSASAFASDAGHDMCEIAQNQGRSSLWPNCYCIIGSIRTN
jgi:predicted ATPase